MLQFILNNWKEIGAIAIGIWELAGRAIPTKKPIVPTTLALDKVSKLSAWLRDASKVVDNLK